MQEREQAAGPGAWLGSARWRPLAEFALIAALTLTLNLVGNGAVGLWDRDEPRYATCTREMAERHDWIFPTFNGQPRFHKPVLIYWLMRAGTALGGDNPFGARLVSAFAGMVTCLVVWRLGRSIGGPRVGLMAALILAVAPIMVAESKLATTDATLCLLFVLAQACVWRLGRRESPRAAIGFWVALGLMILLKGPVGPALVAASGLLSWWWGGPSVAWRRVRWKAGLAIVAALALPWYVVIGVASRGEFFRFAVQTQLVQRVTTGLEQHGGFPGYYAVLSLPLFYPWSALVPAGLVLAWTRRRVDAASGFLLGWIVGPMIVLECVTTKLIHYYLPGYPACAILVAWTLAEGARLGHEVGRWPLGRLAIRLIGAIGVGGGVILLASTVAVPGPLRGPLVMIALVLGAGTLLARVALAGGQTERGVRALVVTWAMVMALFGGWLAPAFEPFRLSRAVGERLAVLADRTGARPAIMTYQEPGVVYALGRVAVDVLGPEELAAEVRERGPVLLPLLPEEVDPMLADRRFACREAGAVLGFNANKGKQQVLHLVVIDAKASSSGGRTLARTGEHSLVK